jgi:hypothetical protein
MTYSREFYALNLAFARRIQQVSHLPLEFTLRQYTNLYIRFGLGYSLDPIQPIWQEFVAGLSGTRQDVEWAYQCAKKYDCKRKEDTDQLLFGCFSYTVWDGKRIRLHFHNQERKGVHPLGEINRPTRRDELQRMFCNIRQNEIIMETVVGGSWLYNLESYRRLFPPDFLSTARPGKQDYPYLTLWGQFLDRDGQVRPEPARQFIDSLDRQSTLEGILDCFPLKVQYLEAPLQVFYDYYAVK